MHSPYALEQNLGQLATLRNEAASAGFRAASVFDDEVWGLAFLAVGEDQDSFNNEVSRVRERLS